MLQMGIQVGYTDLTIFKTPRYSATDWLETVNWSGLLFSRGEDAKNALYAISLGL